VKFILTTLLVSSLFTSVAQNEQTFGDSLFTQFQSDNNQWNDWYISLETYHRLIERQRMSKDVQDDFMLSINESYESQMQNFVSTMQEMQSVYNVEQDDKSYYELTTIKTFLDCTLHTIGKKEKTSISLNFKHATSIKNGT
jgi:hypothetical protein